MSRGASPAAFIATSLRSAQNTANALGAGPSPALIWPRLPSRLPAPPAYPWPQARWWPAPAPPPRADAPARARSAPRSARSPSRSGPRSCDPPPSPFPRPKGQRWASARQPERSGRLNLRWMWKPPLALPCHLRLGQAFLSRGCSRRRGAMEGTAADGREAERGRWLEPFLGRLRRREQRHWAPFSLKGLILPGERKSVEPMAARVAPGDL